MNSTTIAVDLAQRLFEVAVWPREAAVQKFVFPRPKA